MLFSFMDENHCTLSHSGTHMDPSDFSTSIVGNYVDVSPPDSRPHVTLTFAQSSDAKLAGENGKQLILSGKESMVMTHWLRTNHDSIMVGIGTALSDDPQLNTRHLPPRDEPYPLPRPVILDAHLRLHPGCKLLRNFQARNGRRPWVVCHASSVDLFPERKQALEAAGAKIIPVSSDDGNLLSIPNMLKALRDLEIKSLMVEGGARVIQTFFAHPDVVDSLIVTVAPHKVEEGVSHGVQLNYNKDMDGLKHVSSQKFGVDTVYAWTRSHAQK